MIRKTGIKNFLSVVQECLLVDVRSPVEFNSGHIPESLNIPLFTDDERAVVGTLYQKQGREKAILKGMDFSIPKISYFIETLKLHMTGKGLAIHCWRGGMRSEKMAEVFNNAGYDVSILEGGYKAYRRFVRESFTKNARVIVLGGYTGCGKTEILGALSQLGEQVVDLEHLASHKGSVFGALGQGSQPTNEQFENNLYRVWVGMDFRKRIWMEDESRSIGRVALPPPVFDMISSGRMVQVVLDRKKRISRLVSEYAGFDRELLAEALFRIREGLGGTRYKQALEALGQSDFGGGAEFALEYYDKAYQKAIEKRQNKDIVSIDLKGSDPMVHAKSILYMLKNHK